MATVSRLVCLLAAVVTILAANPATDARANPAIDAAIKKGVAALKTQQAVDGSWGSYGVGTTALAAVTLLECGTPAEDPAVRKAASYVRNEVLRIRHTYSLALAIVFLDRLGSADDRVLIQLLTERLIAGQQPDGGWTYHAGPIDEKALAKLKPKAGDAPPVSADGRNRLDAGEGGGASLSDQSNTQFAILGVWAGRRHGVNADDCLKRVERRFRLLQVPPGGMIAGWAYTEGATEPTGPNTCAGLLGLAVGAGSRIERTLRTGPADKSKTPTNNPMDDAQVRAGLGFLNIEFQKEMAVPPSYYFLWSFERVMMAFNLTKLHGLDWHTAGAAHILAHQNPDGSWHRQYPAEIDSCFALLFLVRSNLTRDLSATLKKLGHVELKAGPDKLETEVEALVKAVFDKPADQRLALLEKYRDATGPVYTEALARVISKVTEPLQKQTRDLLATRLSRMTAITIRDRLRDPDAEIRRAAAVACAMREDKQHIPDLIAVLDDADPWVVRAVGVALRVLTGQDFGPPANATADERTKAVAAWKAWWKKQKG